MVTLIDRAVTEFRAMEAAPGYNVGVKTKCADPMKHVKEFKQKILAEYPDVDFKVIQRADRDFTIKVYGDYEEMDDVPEILGDAGIDLLMDEDVWIVVLGLQRHPLDN
jgi:hypothetical protein